MPDPDQRHLGRATPGRASPTGTSCSARWARPSTSASIPPTAGSAACRSATSPASRSSCARSSTGPPPCSSTASTPSRSRARSSRETSRLLSLVPTQLIRLLEADADLSAPRAILIGGGPVPPDALREALGRGATVVQTYGMTETCSQVTTLAPEDAERRVGSAGRPLFTSHIRIEAGEILVQGPTVAPGCYEAGRLAAHRRPRATSTRRASSTSPGRSSEVIVTGGENVMPAEVEAVLIVPSRRRGRRGGRTPGSRVAGGRLRPGRPARTARGDGGGAALATAPPRSRPTRSRSRSTSSRACPGPPRASCSGASCPSRPAASIRRLMAADEVLYDKDADLSALEGKTIAILGYGSQGHAHALNLKDSGMDVVVGLRPDSSSRADAEAEGLEVLDVADAASRGDIVMILLPGREAGSDLARGDLGRDRGRQPADVRPRLRDPLRADRAATRRRRRHGRAEGPGPPGPPRVRRRAGRALPDGDPPGRHRHRARPGPGLRQRASAAAAPGSSRPPSRTRPRPTSSASRPSSAAAPPSWSAPASTRWSRPATTRGSPTSSACTSSS